MLDDRIEDQVRRTLRAEADALPMTIGADELQRRLLLRRRERDGRRLTTVAAVIAVLAIGTMVALTNGWLRLPAIGALPATSPSPTPAASVAPTTVPSVAPSPTPRAADPIGSAGQAILVTAVGDDAGRPDTFEVVRFDPATRVTSSPVVLPGSILPADGRLDPDRAPRVSQTGFLAIPFLRGRDGAASRPAVLIQDLRAGDRDPWIIDGVTAMSWDQTDKLVMDMDGKTEIAWGISRYIEPFTPADPSVVIATDGGPAMPGPLNATQDARFVATTTTEPTELGYLTFAGDFQTTTDLPPVYQRSGLERPAGVKASTLAWTCDPAITDGKAGCALVEHDATGPGVSTWLTADRETGLVDDVWGIDGRSVWILLDGGSNGAGGRVASLAFATKPGGHQEIARIGDVPDIASARILGISMDQPGDPAALVAIGDTQGRVRAFALPDGGTASLDGTAWFAGWADDWQAYDPD